MNLFEDITDRSESESTCDLLMLLAWLGVESADELLDDYLYDDMVKSWISS